MIFVSAGLTGSSGCAMMTRWAVPLRVNVPDPATLDALVRATSKFWTVTAALAWDVVSGFVTG